MDISVTLNPEGIYFNPLPPVVKLRIVTTYHYKFYKTSKPILLSDLFTEKRRRGRLLGVDGWEWSIRWKSNTSDRDFYCTHFVYKFYNGKIGTIRMLSHCN